MASLVTKAPWPAEGIEYGSQLEDYCWGYLYLYDDGDFEFIADEQPESEEIQARWGHYFQRRLPAD